MNIKLSPLVIFLLLLFSLVFSILFQNFVSKLSIFNEISNSSSNNKYEFFSNWLNIEGYTDKVTAFSNTITSSSSNSNSPSNSNSNPKKLNIDVYDICGVLVDNPESSTLYYDKKKNLLNFPNNKTVYDEVGNVISVPPIVGFMLDSAGNILDTPFYDVSGVAIKDISKYSGPVYDSYHNLIGFPYFDSNGEFTISNVLTPDILQSYLSYLSTGNNNTDSSKYSTVSCQYGCIDYSKSLDDYISDYYQQFWNDNKQIYSDDYILKSSINSKSLSPDTGNNYTWGVNSLGKDGQSVAGTVGKNSQSVASTLGRDAQNVAGTIGRDAQNVAGTIGRDAQNVAGTVGRDVQNVAGTVGKDVQNAAGTVGRDVQNVASTVGKDLQNVASTVGSDIQSVAGTVGSDIQSVASTLGKDAQSVAGTVGSGISSAFNMNSTKINGSTYYDDSVKNNNRGTAGYYNGDNTVSNMGYMKGTNQFSTALPTDVANFNNNYNATPSNIKTSNFVPVTADFSKFGR